MNKNVKISVLWILAIYTLYVGFKVFFPSKNQMPADLVEQTVDYVDRSSNSSYDLMTIENVEQSLLDKYEFHIAIDLSASVNNNLTKDRKDEILINLIGQIRDKFIDKGLAVKTYFFGTNIVEIKQEDVSNFSKDKLNEYKKIQFPVNGGNLSLESLTNIVLALQKVLDNADRDDKKEKFIIFITDDILSPNYSANLSQECDAIRKTAKNTGNTSFILYKYPGADKGIGNFIQNNFSDLFEQKNVKLENIAKELVANLQLSMYAHDLTTVSGNEYDNKIPCIEKDKNYKLCNATVANSRFRAEFLGKGDENVKKIELYPQEDITWLNFKFLNEYNYFPIKVKLKNISFCSDSTLSIQLEDNVKTDATHFFTPSNFILAPKQTKIFSIPVKIQYKNNFLKSLISPFSKENIADYLKIEYELEFLGNNEIVYANIFKTINSEMKNQFAYKNKKMTFTGKQANQLEITKASGGKENLLAKTYSPSMGSLAIWLIILFFYAYIAILNAKPTLKNWIITRNGESRTFNDLKLLRIPGDYGDPQGDVVVKASAYRISLNPFKQPKDSIKVNFKYGGDRIDNNGTETGEAYRGVVTLHSGQSIKAKIYDDITLEIK
jgi:hypothetical protein